MTAATVAPVSTPAEAVDTSALMASPPISRSSSQSSLGSRRAPTHLSLDLSQVPPMTQPADPSNTLLITNLDNPLIFRPDHLKTFETLIASSRPIFSFSPLKTFRRIIAVFQTTEDATAIRQLIDGQELLGSRIKVYFAESTSLVVDESKQHLQAPHAQKQFFISPPPSPPCGWEMRNEAPPNQLVHPGDILEALAKINAQAAIDVNGDLVKASTAGESSTNNLAPDSKSNRARSGSSTLVFDPQAHGSSPHLPAIAVEDTTNSPLDLSPKLPDLSSAVTHTSRPPLETMQDA